MDDNHYNKATLRLASRLVSLARAAPSINIKVLHGGAESRSATGTQRGSGSPCSAPRGPAEPQAGLTPCPCNLINIGVIMSEYWESCLDEIFSNHGVELDFKKIIGIAADVDSAAEIRGGV